MKLQSNSHNAFKFSIITIISLLVFILVQFLVATEKISLDTYTFASGFSIVLVFVSTIIGCLYSFKSLKEPNSIQKVIALVANTVFMVLLCATIIANLMDFRKAFF